jgi:hypothetical protein
VIENAFADLVGEGQCRKIAADGSTNIMIDPCCDPAQLVELLLARLNPPTGRAPPVSVNT